MNKGQRLPTHEQRAELLVGTKALFAHNKISFLHFYAQLSSTSCSHSFHILVPRRKKYRERDTRKERNQPRKITNPTPSLRTIPEMFTLSLFAFKPKNGNKAEQPCLEQLTSEQKHVETSSHRLTYSQTKTYSKTSQLQQNADTASRIPCGTQVIELRDPVALAHLVEQRLRKRKKGKNLTETWRLTLGVSRNVEKHEKDDSCLVPRGTIAVALKEPVPLANLRETASDSAKDGLKTRGKVEKVRVVVRG